MPAKAEVVKLEPLLLNTKDASKYIGVSVNTLQNWRSQGLGPKYVHVSKPPRSPVLYRRSDLDEWAASLPS